MEFAVCDALTGAILRIGTCASIDLANQAQDGELVARATQQNKTAMVLAASAEEPPPLAIDITKTDDELQIVPADEVANHIAAVEAFGGDIKAWQDARPAPDHVPEVVAPVVVPPFSKEAQDALT